MSQDYADIRREYCNDTLSEEQLITCPIALFERWFDEYSQHERSDPTAMVVSTVISTISLAAYCIIESSEPEGFRFLPTHTVVKATTLNRTRQ